MGQAQTSSIWNTYQPSANIVPGTYRLVHDGTDKVLQLQDDNHKTLILKPRQDKGSDGSLVEDDHWFLLRSGDGFIFKHCRQGTYITSLLTTASPQSVCATRYPTTWVIHTKDGNSAKCAITIAMDQNESGLGAKFVGLGVTWAGLCIAPLPEKEAPDQVWRLERVGDATIEEDYEHRISELERELQAANARRTLGESSRRAMLQELESKEANLENIRSELSKQATELENVRAELSKQADELKEQFKTLDSIRDLLDDKERALSEKDKSVIYDYTIVREKVPELHGAQGSQGLAAVDGEAFLKGKVELANQELPYEHTNNALGAEDAVHWPVSESAPPSDIEAQTAQTPAMPAKVDQDLLKLGWSFDHE